MRRIFVILSILLTVSVHDGDTITLNGTRIRLWGIDAPELAQSCENELGQSFKCGDSAKNELVQLIGNKSVSCEAIDIDRYGRTVARCTAGEADLNAEMVKSGWALEYVRYSHGAFHHEEADAKQNGRGIWAGSFVKPWDWRHERH